MVLLENLFSPGTIERLGWMLVHFLWQAMAVALLLTVLLRLLRRASANLRYAVACGALALMAVLPLITMQLIGVSGPVAEAGPPPEISPPAMIEPLPVIVGTVNELPPLSSMPTLEAADLTVPIPWQERVIAALEPALPYLVLGWLAGVFGLSAWHLGGWAQLQRLRRRMTRKAESPLRATLVELAESLGVRRAVTLLESAVVEVPTVVGWLRPVILLPASALTGLSPDQLRAILAHELAHIRRYDYFANILQTVVEILGFYHPAVWWVSGRIRIERENCCDDLAVQVCGNSLQYARALASMEEIRHSRSDLALAASGGSLMARIARLLGRPAVDDRRFAWLPGLIALLLVTCIIIPTALVFASPRAAPTPPSVWDSNTMSPGEPGGDGPNSPNQTVTAVQSEIGAETQDEAEILLEFAVAKALADAPLDREAMLMIGHVLAAERPQIGGQIAADSKPSLTLGELLKKYVTGQSLSPETSQALLDLLRTRGFVNVRSSPKVVTSDGQPAHVQIVSQVRLFPPSSQDGNAPAETSQVRMEYGTWIDVTPHVGQDENVTLDVAVKVVDPVPQTQASEAPTTRVTEITTTLTTQNNRSPWLLVEPSGSQNAADRDPESLLVVLTPKNSGSTPQPAQPADQSASQAPQRNNHRRPVLLDVRVVAIDRANLLNVGVEWSYPTIQAGRLDNDDWARGLSVGYSTDSTFTSSLLRTLNQLGSAKQADILSNPQVMALDGRAAQLRSVQEEWFMISDPSAASLSAELQKIESGTILTITPRVGDSNEITIEMAIEASNSILRGQMPDGPKDLPADVPVVTRRQAKNSVTVMNGGTVAVAGLTENPDGQNGKPPREIAIFVTATLISESNGTPLSSPQGMTIAPPAPSPDTISATSTRTDLLRALAQISKNYGVHVAVDLAVKPQPVTADLGGTSAETAIRQVLKDTPYVFRRVTETDPPTYLVYRSITAKFEGIELSKALQDLSAMAGVAILRDADVQGKVTARIEKAPLEEALQIVLVGTPYLFKKMSDHYIVADRRPAINNPSRGDVPQVHLTVTMARVQVDQRLDRDTAAEVFSLIAPTGNASAEMSLNELRTSTVGQILSRLAERTPAERFKAVVQLLASKEFLDKVAEPEMVVPSGRTAEMKGEGQAVKAYVEVMKGGQTVRLDAEASMQISKPLPTPPGEASNPSSHVMTMRTVRGSGTLEVPNDRHGLLALGGMSSGTDQADAETCYLILHPALVTPNAQEEASEEQTRDNADRISQARPNMRHWNLVNVPETRYLRLNHQTPQRVLSLLPAKYQKYVHARADNTPDSNQVLTVTAPSEITYTVVGMIRDFDSPPPQIVLNEWIVEMERADLPSLGVQWSLPTTQVGQTPADGGQPEGILIGFLSDGSSTDSFLARLNLLDITKRARILTGDQIISQDGRPTQLLSIPEVWANYPSAQAAREASRNREETRKILAGRLLSIVPHLGDHNDITFDIPVHVSNRVATKSKDNSSNKPPSDIPGVTGRQAQNSITIMNGGTIVIARLAKNTGRQSGRSREIAIFATASLIPARGWIENSLAALPCQSRVSVTPSPHENLLTVLAQICESSSIQIAVDPTVKRQSATADLVGLSGEAAIQQALKGTPYVFRRVSETDPPLYLIYRPITAEFDGVALGYALHDLAAKAEVPILPHGSMSGKVRARIENANLAEALDTVLTGMPYTVRKGQNCYFVAE